MRDMPNVPLIPRQVLFGNADRVAPKLSPDGQYLSWLSPVEGVMNIWVAPVAAVGEAQPVTSLSGRPMQWHEWSGDGRFLLFGKDETGDENAHVYAVPPTGGAVRDLTPLQNVAAQAFLISPDLPGQVIVGLNDRDARHHDIWSVNIATGHRTMVFENTAGYGWFCLDWQGQVRLAMRRDAASGETHIYRIREGEAELWMQVPFEDSLTTGPLFFNRSGIHFFMNSSVGRDTAALLRVDSATGQQVVLGEHPRADLTNAISHPETFEIEAYSVDPARSLWIALNVQTQLLLGKIAAREPAADFGILSMSRDNRLWVACLASPQQPGRYVLVETDTGNIRDLFDVRPALAPYRLAPMQDVVIPSRDGLDLVCYCTLPADEPGQRPRQPLPMVLCVHGGPWFRDSYGYNRDHQFLANRGYAVLSVNYRASTGFGKAFVNAGDREHAAKIHHDLLDAVEWAVTQGIAVREKVAILGGSYGGYAAFVGATFTPEVFCCSVPVVGITDLITLLENRPPYWADFMDQFYRRYGDPRTPEGRELLRSRSPLYKVDAISKPMLIGHGANDVRCTLAQSDLIVAAMQAKGLPVTYVVYPDEGHGFARPENNIAFHAILEAFLARHLGGRAEPAGSDFTGSSHQIRAGADVLEAHGG